VTHARTSGGANPPSALSQTSPILLTLALLGCVASVAAVAIHRPDRPAVALAFGAMIAVGEALRVRLPGDREAAPLGAAVALAYAVVTQVGGSPADHRTAQAVAVAGFGFLLGALPHLAVRRPSTLDFTLRRFLAVALTAWLFRMLYLDEYVRSRTPGHTSGAVSSSAQSHTVSEGMAMAAALAISLLVDALIGAIVQAGHHRRPFFPALRDELRFTVSVGVAVDTTALLVGLACRTMALWVLPVLCVPLLLTQLSLRRFARVKDVHLETIRALSRITELAGLTEPGHARRVARMSQLIGRELGLSESELLDLEYAALMHDIGQLSLADPLHGGRTANLPPERQRELATAGADVIRRAGTLDQVADIVGRHAEPFRDGGSLGSRILRVANAFDDLAGPAPEPAQRTQALAEIRSGLAVHYDPVVVESLSRIVGDEP
jgi:HD-GYP domain-containing protein (c-di-GMP phosphodiesterase class II)